MSQKVLMAVAHGSEDMEVVITADILRRAGIELTLASVETELQLTFANGTQLVADALLSDVYQQQYDLIVLPGGLPGAEHLRDSTALTELLQQQKADERWIAAICASPAVVLQHHGLLDGTYVTCYPAFQDKLDEEYLMPEDAVVIDEHNLIITSQGPGTAMRFAICLVEVLQGEAAAEAVEEPLCMLIEYADEEEEDEHQCCGGGHCH